MGANDYLDEGLAAQLVGVFRHSRVLDLGCGLGHYGHYLQARVRRLARLCQPEVRQERGSTLLWKLCLLCYAVSTVCFWGGAFLAGLLGSMECHRMGDRLAARLAAGH